MDYHEMLQKYLERYSCLSGVVITDREGVLVVSEFEDKLLVEVCNRCIEAVAPLSQTIAQANATVTKMQGKQECTSATFYYDIHTLHLAYARSLLVCLFLKQDTSLLLAKEIANDLHSSLTHLNPYVAELKSKYS